MGLSAVQRPAGAPTHGARNLTSDRCWLTWVEQWLTWVAFCQTSVEQWLTWVGHCQTSVEQWLIWFAFCQTWVEQRLTSVEQWWISYEHNWWPRRSISGRGDQPVTKEINQSQKRSTTRRAARGSCLDRW